MFRLIGILVSFLAVAILFSEEPAHAQPGQTDKGLFKAIQKVPSQAQEKLLMAAQKGQHKGQFGGQKGGKGAKAGKGAGKGKS
ncbi:MAG: hypothetical protein HYR84_12900 [Planctomycetes bacterium]|nr:hypothetical protein [Planctomycetota bacterium]